MIICSYTAQCFFSWSHWTPPIAWPCFLQCILIIPTAHSPWCCHVPAKWLMEYLSPISIAQSTKPKHPPSNTHTYTPTHARTHAHTHARTHTRQSNFTPFEYHVLYTWHGVAVSHTWEDLYSCKANNLISSITPIFLSFILSFTLKSSHLDLSWKSNP